MTDEPRPDRPTLVLLFNRMFGTPLPLPDDGPPPGFELSEDSGCLEEADVVVFHLPELQRPWRLRKRPGQLWVAWSMECDVHYPHHRRLMTRFDLRMTYRRDADVRFTYVPPDFPVALAQPPAKREGLVCSLVSSRFDRSGRMAYTDALAEHLDLHRYGRLPGCRPVPDDRGRPSRLALFEKYKFVLAFENAIAEDYVTEKLFEPLMSGAVPVYLGALNANDLAPGEGCFIATADFQRPSDLARHLVTLGADEGAYARLQAWRSRPLRADFLRLLAQARENGFVRLCRVLNERAGRGLSIS